MLLMSRSRVRAFAGFVGAVLAAGVSLVPVAANAASAPTVSGVPKATALVPVKAHRLANVVVAGHGVTAFKALGTAGVPASGVAAVVLKLTASKPGASGALVAYPTGAKRPAILSVSFAARHDVTGVVVVVPGSKGRISTANLSSKAVRVIPTIVGYYRKVTATSAALTYFKAVAPRQAASVRVAAGGSVAVTVAGARGVPKAGTAGVVLELSALTPAKSGSLTVSPSAGTKSKVTALAFKAGRNATNTVTAPAGSKGRVIIANRSKGVVRVRVDVVGYLIALAPAGGRPGGVTLAPHAGGVTLTWLAAKTDPGAPVVRYGVIVSQTLPKPATSTVYTVGPVLALDVTGLLAGVPYQFQVFAVTKEGRSAPSPLTAPVVLSPPAAPTGVTAVASAAGSVTVSWVHSVNAGPPVLGYTITGAHSGPVTAPATATSYTFTGLTPGQTLVATVTASNAIGTSPASAPSAAVVVTGGPGTNVTSPVSVDTAGAYHGSGVTTATPSISADGRYVVFSSVASITGGDNAHHANVFLRDRQTGTTTLISTPGAGVYGNDDSLDPSISRDGRFIAFDSKASNLVAGDTNTRWDVYVYDTVGATLTLASVGTLPEGAQSKDSTLPALSADGRYVAFLSNSEDLVASETNLFHGIYVRDTTTGTTTRVSQAAGGGLLLTDLTRGPSISADGRYVGYATDASNVVVGDSNGSADAFLYDRTANTTTRVSLGQAGVQANGASQVPQLSADDRYAVFASDATNLVAGDTNAVTDVFVRDLTAGTTARVSVGNDGSQANAASSGPSLSSDGNRVLFTSAASNLVVGDTNAQPDAFVRYLGTGETIRVSVAAGQLATGATAGAISGNGLVALFTTADALAPTDVNTVPDLFARTLG
jgi:Tol biopolymer transport system component